MYVESGIVSKDCLEQGKWKTEEVKGKVNVADAREKAVGVGSVK